MKVSDLKKELDKYPDNMDIKFYNGMVDDWMNIKLQETEVVMDTPALSKILYPNSKKRKEWEFPNEFVNYNDPKQKKFYRFKKILLIGGKLRGKMSVGWTSSDDVEY